MSEIKIDIEKAKDLSSKTLAQIEASKLAPTPETYSLIYTYFSAENPEVAHAIDTFLRQNDALTEAAAKEIYDSYLSLERHEKAFQEASSQMDATINTVSGSVDTVKRASGEYGHTLQDMTSNIQSAESVEDVQKIVKSIAQGTQKMLTENQTLEQELAQSAQLMAEMQRDMEKMRHETMTDGLTGISNRKAFDAEIDDLIKESQENTTPLCLMMLDIDYFKKFNDTFGHQVGDQVLRLVAKTLKDGVKGRDFVARYGGEEFSALLPETPLNGAVAVGDALRKALANKDLVNRVSGQNLGKITMSVGVAQYHTDETTESFISRADSALYDAKENGRNRVSTNS